MDGTKYAEIIVDYMHEGSAHQTSERPPFWMTELSVQFFREVLQTSAPTYRYKFGIKLITIYWKI